MSHVNKVPAGAGAEWLLGAFALLRKAPLALCMLGLGWGLLSMVAVQAAALDAVLGTALQLLMAVLAPLLLAGVLWAVRELDEGRVAPPSLLFHAFGSDRKLSLLLTLLPQIAAVAVLGALLAVMIAPEDLQRLATVSAELNAIAAAGGQPDVALLESLPLGRFLLWILLVFAAAIGVSLVTFVAVPDIVFGGNGALTAMRNSLRACLRNLPALVVLCVLFAIAMMAIGLGIFMLGMVVEIIAGSAAAAWVTNLALVTVFLPLWAGVVYYAWRQMLGGGATVERAAVADRFEA